MKKLIPLRCGSKFYKWGASPSTYIHIPTERKQSAKRQEERDGSSSSALHEGRKWGHQLRRKLISSGVSLAKFNSSSIFKHQLTCIYYIYALFPFLKLKNE